MREEIRVIKRKLENYDEIELYSVADLHWEDPNTDRDLFLRFVSYILSKPNRFIVLNGDMTDMALITSVSDSYGSDFSPSEAVDMLSSVLKQISHRVVAAGTGNHESRVYKLTGIDVTEHMLMKSGVSLELYHNNSFLLMLEFGSQKYSGYFQHGQGGGKMKGGKLNMVTRMAEVVDADLFTTAHVHDPMFTPLKSFKINYELEQCEPHLQYCMISNAWQCYGGYGQTHGFRPAPNTIIYYTLSGLRKDIRLHTIDL